MPFFTFFALVFWDIGHDSELLVRGMHVAHQSTGREEPTGEGVEGADFGHDGGHHHRDHNLDTKDSLRTWNSIKNIKSIS